MFFFLAFHLINDNINVDIKIVRWSMNYRTNLTEVGSDNYLKDYLLYMYIWNILLCN